MKLDKNYCSTQSVHNFSNNSSWSDVLHAPQLLQASLVALDIFRKRDRDSILDLVEPNHLRHPLELLQYRKLWRQFKWLADANQAKQ